MKERLLNLLKDYSKLINELSLNKTDVGDDPEFVAYYQAKIATLEMVIDDVDRIMKRRVVKSKTMGKYTNKPFNI